MITKDQAVNARYREEFHAGKCKRFIGPRGGERLQVETWRVNGKCQTWKTRPDEFRLPIKYGLKTCGEMTQRNAYLFHPAEECSPVVITNIIP